MKKLIFISLLVISMFLIVGCSTGEAMSDQELEQAISQLSAAEQDAVFAADTALAGQASKFSKFSLSRSKVITKLRQEIKKRPIEYQKKIKTKIIEEINAPNFNSCTDPDQGTNPYYQKTITTLPEYNLFKEDYCQGNILFEQHCAVCADYPCILAYQYDCTSEGKVCVDGACVESYFVDPNLEAAIREAINKPEGEITEEDFLDNNCLNLNNKGITNLRGLERFTGITCLLLNENQITDLSPLSSLTNLQRLELLSNRITDISHLSGLINLNYLGLGDNQIADISFLSGLINLQELYLNHNKITDISHLLRLNYLEVLWLGKNYLDTGDCNNINTLKERGVTFDPNTQDINDLLAECALT